MLAVLLVIALALPQCYPAHPDSDPTQDINTDTVIIIYRPLPGAEFTPLEQSAFLLNLARAFEWWEELAPKPVHLVVSSDLYTNTTVVDPIYVIVVDPSIRHDIANYNSRTLQVAIEEQDQEQMIAHELGHVLYNLPDWYLTPSKCIGPDIMCGTLLEAYETRQIGIRSLNFLDPVNHPIYITYIPGVKGGN